MPGTRSRRPTINNIDELLDELCLVQDNPMSWELQLENFDNSRWAARLTITKEYPYQDIEPALTFMSAPTSIDTPTSVVRDVYQKAVWHFKRNK